MPRTDPRIDAYIAKSAPFAQPILRHLRALVHAAAPEVEETIKWNMPNFVRGGKILCGMAAFKAHCSFGFWHRGMTELLVKEGFATEEAMGHLGRITGPGDLPSDATLRRFIKAAAKLMDSAPARPRPAPSPRIALRVPADLATALRTHAAAAATFKAFSYSKRKDYIEWLTEAKRPATREQRLATTLEWLAAGKARNWKYERR
ncbi:YdeI/OmpD-associated family protein [Horticoccus luteus]|uniref:YdeI/OmpD-associated family protein n=1 Tax=Horticoccus luteus TaxID=2862869 RepID=A0A8F9TXT1_9BACT|nr:YdeI/OmpD-associated family protein [Horticoccus luteus]QYM80105.1 YdeI/OmpD-associated family protein [Horticoccus luteus]